MLWVRGFIYGFPVVIAVLAVASFWRVDTLQELPRNELLLGSGGEAKTLNPILSTTTSDSRVNQFIFNGLLKFSEDLELVGDLARDWTVEQRSTVFFANPVAAEEFAAVLDGRREEWDGWSLRSVEVDGRGVLMRFGEPGERTTDLLLDAVGDAFVGEGLSLVGVAVKSSARESMAHFLESATNASDVVRQWVGSSTGYQLVVAGDPAPLIEELGNYYEANPDQGGQFAVGDRMRALNEPRIVFHLRDDVFWHDGEPFTSADAVFTYRRIVDETVASPRRPDFELISQVDAPDAHTFVVDYRKPYSSALMSWTIGMLPEHILEGRSTSWWATNFNRSPVGTGPFRFVEWRSNEFIRLDRNPDYFLGAPHLETIAVRTIPDQVAIRLAFETRQIDYWGVDDHAVSAFRKDKRYDIFSSLSTAYEYIGWNLRREMFQDLRVRKALAHAVDVGAIIQYVVYGYGERSTGPFVPTTWYYNEGITPFEYDPERAKRLLAEAGWTPGPDGILVKGGRRFSFELLTAQGGETRKDIATLVQADLARIGIEVEIGILEWTVFIKQVTQDLDFDAVVLGWSLGFDYDQYQIWHSSQVGAGMLNTAAYRNPEVDALLERIRGTFDRDEIKRLCGEMQRIIYEDQPYLFLYVPETIGAMWKDAYRVRRPGTDGWVDEKVRSTNAGFTHYLEWWYRPDYRPEISTGG